jgi:hypothetical protein
MNLTEVLHKRTYMWARYIHTINQMLAFKEFLPATVYGTLRSPNLAPRIHTHRLLEPIVT